MNSDQLQKNSSISVDTQSMMVFEANKKSMGLSYLLWFLLGGLGGHRFYLGKTVSAIGMITLLIFGGLLSAVGIGLFFLIALGIWVLVDAFLIPGIVNRHNNNLISKLSGNVSL